MCTIANFRTVALLTALLTLTLAVGALAMPPHPQVESRIANGEMQLPAFMTAAGKQSAQPISAGDDDVMARFLSRQKAISGLTGSPAVSEFRILAILVQFSDHASQVSATFFDSLLFSTNGGTVRDYYDEISYGQIDLVTVDVPSSTGWQTAPNPYSYYVNGAYGTGSYPQNSQGLVADLVDLVNPTVNFDNYDNDGDGYVDILLVIHSGTGAEYSGQTSDIWSHQWSLPFSKSADNVAVRNFTVQPELWSSPGDMTIGVYCHELCHGFGLPDLYDIDGSSRGIGRWGLMSGGSWNGSLGNSPAHPCAWSRIELGVSTPVNVTTNQSGVTVTPVETGGTIYRLWDAGAVGDEYFLVENRQKTGYDSYLPGSGLMIWHCDDGVTTNYGSNATEWYPGMDPNNHFVVALEQADGLYELEHNGNSDNADPFPGTTNRQNFNTTGDPNSNSYTAGSTLVAVQNITTAGSNVVTDFIVNLASAVGDDTDGPILPERISLSQNYPNPFNPTTSISFTLNQAVQLELDIYNIAGQKVKTLTNGFYPAGDHTVDWDATNDDGGSVASGVYFYRLQSTTNEEVKKMVLIR